MAQFPSGPRCKNRNHGNTLHLPKVEQQWDYVPRFLHASIQSQRQATTGEKETHRKWYSRDCFHWRGNSVSTNHDQLKTSPRCFGCESSYLGQRSRTKILSLSCRIERRCTRIWTSFTSQWIVQERGRVQEFFLRQVIECRESKLFSSYSWKQINPHSYCSPQRRFGHFLMTSLLEKLDHSASLYILVHSVYFMVFSCYEILSSENIIINASQITSIFISPAFLFASFNNGEVDLVRSYKRFTQA